MEATKLRPVDTLQPPALGEAKRDAIKSLIDGVSTELSKRVKAVHGTADRLEQTMLQSAARAKAILDDHVAVCQTIDDETTRLESILDRLSVEHGAS